MRHEADTHLLQYTRRHVGQRDGLVTLADICDGVRNATEERHTATVHHSMSALQPALKALATDVGAKPKRGSWGYIIDAVEIEISALKGGKCPKDRFQFLTQAAKEFFYSKDGWRNYVAHAKVQYDREQALSVFNHVGTFMRHLASKLHE